MLKDLFKRKQPVVLATATDAPKELTANQHKERKLKRVTQRRARRHNRR